MKARGNSARHTNTLKTHASGSRGNRGKNRSIALVTGGSGGIGAEICTQMLEAGYEVISLDRRVSRRTHRRYHAVEVDLLDESAFRQVLTELSRRFALTHVVHNAGFVRPAPVGELKEVDLHALTRIHLSSAVLLVQSALPHMKSIGFGRIVLMSSRGALGAPGRSAYSATKAGLIGLARTWALELASCGITVNVVAPGPIGGTDVFHSVVPEGSDREAALARSIPVGRLGRASDVARAVMFFAGRECGFITGQTLYVCGGSSVGTAQI